MSNRDLATGLFRAWGIIWSIYVLIAVPQFLNILLRDPYGSEQGAMRQYVLSSHAISIGCQIAVAILLIRRAGWLAELVFPSDQQTTFVFGADDLRAVLFSAVGLYFLIVGLEDLVGSAFQLITRPEGNNQNAFAYLWQRDPERLATGLCGAVAGAFVLLGRGRFLNPWKRVKGAYHRLLGLKESPSE